MNLKFQLEHRKMSHESWLDGSTFKGITVFGVKDPHLESLESKRKFCPVGIDNVRIK